LILEVGRKVLKGSSRALRGRRAYAFALASAAFLALGPAAVGPSAAARVSLASAPPITTGPLLMPLSREQATLRNASVAIEAGVGPAALPFLSAAYDSGVSARALECLATAVYYEAASEPLDTQRAVAQVVLNRMRHPNYPNSICGVVYEGSSRRTGCQFTFTCDGAMHRRRPDAAGWRAATRIAAQALNGYVHAPVGLATHFHADWVVPYWATSLAKVGKFGTTIFYRWRGDASRASAFSDRYSGVEPKLFAAPPVEVAGGMDPLPELTAEAARILVSYTDEVKAVAKVDDFGLLGYAVTKSEPTPMEASEPMFAQAIGAASKGDKAAVAATIDR
jgi:hypothetical protein